MKTIWRGVLITAGVAISAGAILVFGFGLRLEQDGSGSMLVTLGSA